MALQGDFFPAGACEDDVADASLVIGDEFNLRLGGALRCDRLWECLGVERDVREVDGIRMDVRRIDGR
jgi:hypothetical protein